MNNKPLVSVIVSTRNSASTIGDCVKSIKEQSYANVEIIVVDNNSTDDTKKIALKYTKNVFNKDPERSAQRNYGALKARGTYVLFIDSDMHLSKQVVVECVDKFKIQNSKFKIYGVIIPEESFGTSFWAECKALERSFYIGVDWIEAARFFSKKSFVEFKGYDEKQTGTEDFDLPQRIKDKYGEECMSRIKSLIYHNEGNLSLAYTLKKKFYYARTAKVYASTNKTYFSKQASVMGRYKLFLFDPKRLFSNPLVGIGMLFMKTLELLALGLGYSLKK